MRTKDIQGTSVPALGFGTWRLAGPQCDRMVQYALELGYRHIDTAQVYGNESEVGAAIRASHVDRDEIFVTTKIWSDRLDGEDARLAVHESLKRLGLDHVDLILIHWPNPDVPLSRTLPVLDRLREAGKVRQIGASNFTVPLLNEAREVLGRPLFCNQVEYHPFLSQAAVKAVTDRDDTLLTAYCPIARGKVTEDETICAIAEAHGKTPAQIALKWLIDQPRVAAIPKTADPDRCRQNYEIFDFSLSDDETRAIDALDKTQRMINPEWAPDWDPV